MISPFSPAPRATPLGRYLFAGLLVTAGTSLFGDYRPPDQRTNYDSWMQEIRDRPKRSFDTPKTSTTSRPEPTRSAPVYETKEQRLDRMLASYRESPEARSQAAADNRRLAALGQSALAGDVSAMRRYGLELISRTDSSEQTKKIGVDWLRTAAGHGDDAALQWLRANDPAAQRAARIEADQQAKAAAEAAKIQALRLRAQTGEPEAMCDYGFHLLFSSKPDLVPQGREWLRKSAVADYEPALAFMVEDTRGGYGTPEELAQALAWRVQLAKHPKQEDLCYKLGKIYLFGEFGAKKDRAVAESYFEKSWARGIGKDAHFFLAQACALGTGGPRSVPEAITRYRQALASLPESLTIQESQQQASGELMLALLLLEPESEPAAHAAELLPMLDRLVLSPDGEKGQVENIARRAAEVLAAGQLGPLDPDRELYYLSRAVRYADWSELPAKDYDRVAGDFAVAVANRLTESHAPLFLVERRKVRVNYSNGNSLNETRYFREEMTPVKALQVFQPIDERVEESEVRTSLAIGRYVLTLTEANLKEAGAKSSLAFNLFESTAERHNEPAAWLWAGKILLRGKGVPADPVGAGERLQKAWDLGETSAALSLAVLQQRRLVPGASDQAGDEWLRRGAERGNAECMAHWGNHLWAEAKQLPTTDTTQAARAAEALRWLEQARAAGDHGATADLAAIYRNGILVPADPAKSLALMQESAGAGSPQGKGMLAEVLAQGRGLEKDQHRAMTLLHEAALADANAANNFGVVLWRGEWGEKDVETGLKWMEVALDAGLWAAGRNLAKIHHLGLGIPADEEKARAFLERAGTMGGAASARAVAKFYAEGEVITKDPVAAERWQTVAASATL